MWSARRVSRRVSRQAGVCTHVHEYGCRCAGCLMVLAANSDKVKNLIGEQMGVKALTAIVKQHPSPPVLKATLGALAVLSSDERNLGIMREEGMEQLVEKFMKVKDDRVQIFVKQLRDRLYQTGES